MHLRFAFFGSRKSEVQILSPRPVFVRNDVKNGDCRVEAKRRRATILSGYSARTEIASKPVGEDGYDTARQSNEVGNEDGPPVTPSIIRCELGSTLLELRPHKTTCHRELLLRLHTRIGGESKAILRRLHRRPRVPPKVPQSGKQSPHIKTPSLANQNGHCLH